MDAFTPLTTLNDYCNFWKKFEAKKYHLFEADLAKEGMIVTFQNILRKERERIKRNEITALNLYEVPSWIRTCLVSHLGFDHENFDNNQIPDPYWKAASLAENCKEA